MIKTGIILASKHKPTCGDGFDECDITQLENQLTAGSNPALRWNFSQITDLLNGGVYGLGLLELLFFLAGAAFVIYLIMGGIKLMMSAGEPNSVADAKQTITNALVGLLITLFAYWVVEIVGFVFGLSTIGQIFR